MLRDVEPAFLAFTRFLERDDPCVLTRGMSRIVSTPDPDLVVGQPCELIAYIGDRGFRFSVFYDTVLVISSLRSTLAVVTVSKSRHDRGWWASEPGTERVFPAESVSAEEAVRRSQLGHDVNHIVLDQVDVRVVFGQGIFRKPRIRVGSTVIDSCDVEEAMTIVLLKAFRQSWRMAAQVMHPFQNPKKCTEQGLLGPLAAQLRRGRITR